MVKTLRLLMLFLIMGGAAVAQSITVSGTVMDGVLNEPLPGANVVVKGTAIGTSTDFDGNYTIEVPAGDAVLIFSFIGMETKEVAVAGRDVVDVTLGAGMEALDDVIVVAYGTSTKEAFTGAAEVVSSEVIESRPVASVDKALQGTTAGVQVTSSSGQPGSGTSIRIRGVGSISASSSPLYVIDGVAMSGSISDINPNDIESMTVLKDASAASLYGSRAANGVVIITTKRGKKGETRITFDAQSGVSQRISNGYRLMNSSEYYQHTWRGIYNREIIGGANLNDAAATAHKQVEGVSGWNPYHEANPFDNQGNLIPGATIKNDTDWRDAIYKTGIQQNYNLTVAGGNEQSQLYFSAGYFSDNGTTIGSDYERYSAKLNADHAVNDWLKAGMNMQFSYSKAHAPPAGSGAANPTRNAEIINAATPIYLEDGSYNYENEASFDFNPVALADDDLYEYGGKRALINTYVNVVLPKSLNFKSTFAIDYNGSDAKNFYNPHHGNGAGVGGRLNMSTSENMAWNITNLLSWRHTEGESSYEALLGQEAHAETFKSLSAEGTQFGYSGTIELPWAGQPGMPSSSTSQWSMVSYFGQAKYSYAGKYYASASLRTDGSSRFGENNKYGMFYSIGGGWNMSREEWLNDIDWLDYLKLRGSYGTSGNNSIGNYASFGLYGSGANYGGISGISPIQLAYPDLTWESIASANIALEANFIERLSMVAEFYSRASDGLLMSKPLSSSKGLTSIMQNIGAMVNRGVELTLNYQVIQNANFGWNTGINMTTNYNEIKELGQDRIMSGTKLLEPGSDLYQFYLVEWAGVNPENGRPMWYTNEHSDDKPNDQKPTSGFEDPNGSGRMVTSNYTDAERVRMGSALPKWYGGWTNSLNYKGWDMNFYFYMNMGGKIYNNDYATNMHDGVNPGYNMAADALDAWTPENKYTDVPRYVANNTDQSGQMSSRFLEDATYIRLKNISLSYTLPQNLVERAKMSSFKVFLSGENLWTLTDYNGFDPEQGLNGTTGSNIPGVKTVTLGLKMGL